MTLPHILVFSLAAGWLGAQAGAGWRKWGLLGLSVLALYMLQPPTPIRYLDFWLPTASLALTVIVWGLTRPPASAAASGPEAAGAFREEVKTAAVLAGLVLVMALSRYLDRNQTLAAGLQNLGLPPALTAPLEFNLVGWVMPARPPDTWQVAVAVVLLGGVAAAAARLGPGRPRLASGAVLGLLVLFMVLKTDPLALWASRGLRALMHQDLAQAAALDWRWLGFSYIAFRLIHTLRDRLTKRLPALSLAEFVTYALFLPTLTAGPIDRADRFVKDLRQPAPAWEAGSARLVMGIFKKFVLADTLALFALNGVNAAQTTSTPWMWVLLYAYAGRIYLDFSGYTDIALGLGRLMGFKLPENFDRPYLKPNLTVFWNSWHMTLAQWFRAYFFNPLTRALRSRPLPPWLIILIGQAGTMVLIGLWHGVTWNFAAWGVWHALGLFVHSRWADFARPRLAGLDARPNLKRVATAASTLFTFHYVALGWVWFALPSLSLAGRVFGKLFGINL